MTDLKRLLNPPEDFSAYPQHREFHAEELNSEDVTPLLQEQTWDGLLTELLGSDGNVGNLGQGPNGGDPGDVEFGNVVEETTEWPAEKDVTATLPTPEELNEADEQICYGMIYRQAVRLHGVMADLVTKMREEANDPCPGHCLMGITKELESIVVIFPDKTVFGELNESLSEIVIKLLEHRLLHFEVLANLSTVIETIGKAEKANEAVVRVDINVYGPRSQRKEIGQKLSKSRIYLQRPNYRRQDSIYDNPHFLQLPNVEVNNTEIPIIPGVQSEKETEVDKEEQFKRTIGNVYASLTRSRHLHGLEGDVRLKTSLLDHQKEALEFMIQREIGPIPEEYQLWKPHDIQGQPCYRHVVTRAVARTPQSELGGGVLADEMGMGKSLCVLSLHLKTLHDAHDWSEKEPTVSNSALGAKPRSRGTLIIASSALMITEWFQEIDLHLNDEVRKELKCIKYHGQYRDTDVDVLRDSDIVITTYHTLAADFASKRNPLAEIHWYRIVLDEAHIIRRQATTLNRTASELWAHSRWCLTGTPIQNRLEDIGSLFTFIRLSPFERINTFRRCISIPFDEGGDRKRIAIEAFTKLLDSVVLRRTKKDRLTLPDKYEETRVVHFTPEERLQYEQTKNMMIRAIKHQPGVFDRKSTLGMFQTQLQLRILCNHGTYQDPFSWTRRSLLEEREFAASAIGDRGATTCSSCKQSMPIVGSNAVYRKWSEKCAHVLCMECIEESSHGVDSLSNCPLCHPIWATSELPPDKSMHMLKNGHVDTYFRPQGHSSKMVALIKDVQADLHRTKGIIFSCWTRTLNLIQHYLEQANIQFQRIDGECSLQSRQKTLNEFAKNPALRILIMTTGTGAVGLNLTSANRVFIVEPQWNPSVENQAIARALRIGQKHSVLVTRYLMEGTVEQEMQSQQNVKRSMADLAGTNRG